MDISDTLTPNSSQLDAVDLLVGEKTFSITGVTMTGDKKQPVDVHLAEHPKPWRPNLTMRRLLVAGWGGDHAIYAGRRVTLYNEPSVTYAGKTVGGIRIRAMSHLPERLLKTLPVNSKQLETFTVEPLPDAPAPVDWQARLTQVQGDPDAARELYDQARAAGAPDDYLNAVQAAGQQGEQQ